MKGKKRRSEEIIAKLGAPARFAGRLLSLGRYAP